MQCLLCDAPSCGWSIENLTERSSCCYQLQLPEMEMLMLIAFTRYYLFVFPPVVFVVTVSLCIPGSYCRRIVSQWLYCLYSQMTLINKLIQLAIPHEVTNTHTYTYTYTHTSHTHTHTCTHTRMHAHTCAHSRVKGISERRQSRNYLSSVFLCLGTWLFYIFK